MKTSAVFATLWGVTVGIHVAILFKDGVWEFSVPMILLGLLMAYFNICKIEQEAQP